MPCSTRVLRIGALAEQGTRNITPISAVANPDVAHAEQIESLTGKPEKDTE